MMRWKPSAFGTSASAFLSSNRSVSLHVTKTTIAYASHAEPTHNHLLVLVERHRRVRLDEHLDQDDSILVPSADAFHELRRPDRLFVHKVRQFGHVDTGRAGRRRRDRQILTHGRGGGRTSFRSAVVASVAGLAKWKRGAAVIHRGRLKGNYCEKESPGRLLCTDRCREFNHALHVV